MPLRILYNLVCDSCGEIANPTWIENGLECWRWAFSHGWALAPGNEYHCPECKIEALDETLTPPPGYSAPDVRCGECGTVTRRRTGKCRECGQELSDEQD